MRYWIASVSVNFNVDTVAASQSVVPRIRTSRRVADSVINEEMPVFKIYGGSWAVNTCHRGYLKWSLPWIFHDLERKSTLPHDDLIQFPFSFSNLPWGHHSRSFHQPMLRINRSHDRDSLYVVLHINFVNYWKIVYLQLRVDLFVKVKLPTNFCATSNKLKYELE